MDQPLAEENINNFQVDYCFYSAVKATQRNIMARIVVYLLEIIAMGVMLAL